MLLPRCVLVDPPLDQFDLLRGHLLLRVRGRHSLVLVIGDEPGVDFTLRRIAWHHRELARLDFGKQAVLDVQTHIGLAILLVQTVAGETLFGEQRSDLTTKIHRVVGQSHR